MARFRVFLIGAGQAPLVDLPVDDISALGDVIGQSRFIAGDLVDWHEPECGCRVLIPTSRIQMIADVAA